MIDKIAQVYKGQIIEAFCGRLILQFIFYVVEKPSKVDQTIKGKLEHMRVERGGFM